MSNTPPKASIQVFDSSLNFLGEVDTYESLTHVRGWNKPGDWSVAINWNIFDDSKMLRYASLFQIGGYITIGNDGYKNGIINVIDQPITSDGKQSQLITISGTEISGIFNRRLLNAPAGQDVYTLSAPAETVIKTIISDQCGPTALNANRRFPYLTIATNQARGDNYLVSNAYTNLLDEIANCSIATLLGWSIYLDRANKQLVLDCALGNDLTAGQPNNAIFSTNYDTLLSADLITTNEQYRNLATVTGKGQGASRPVLDVYNGTEPSGFDRFETYVNANDKTSTPDLTLKGQAQLGTYKYTSTLEGMCLAKSPLTYGINYNLGDFVTIEAYNYSLNKQITAIQESWGNLTYELTPTFDKAPATITSQMANSSANLGAQVSKLGFSVSQVPQWQPYPSGTYSFPSGNQTVASGVLAVGAQTTAPSFGTGAIMTAQYRDWGSTIDIALHIESTATAPSNGNGAYFFPLPLGKVFDATRCSLSSAVTNGTALPGVVAYGLAGGVNYVMAASLSPYTTTYGYIYGSYLVGSTGASSVFQWSNAVWAATWTNMRSDIRIMGIPVQ